MLRFFAPSPILRLPLWSMWFGLLSACSSCGVTSSVPASAEGTVPSSTASSEGYTVHEWGLIRGSAGDSLTASAIAPPVRAMPMAVDKPVLYFHAVESLSLRSVEVHAEGGTIEEYWPNTPRTGIAADLGWWNVRITPGQACTFSALPTSCPGPGFCEVPSLALVRVPGADCVHTPDGDDSMLFYRSRSEHFTPPLVYERTSVYGEVSVRNEGDEVIPGWLVRLRNDYGNVVALAVRPPAPHSAIVVGVDFVGTAMPTADSPPSDEDMRATPGSHEPGRRAVELSLSEIGLTEGEAAAFLRAWDQTLFGIAPTLLPVSDDEMADHTRLDGIPADGDGELAPTESFLYFLPAADADRVATLSFDPPPSAVHRALAMWSRVPASGTSR